MIWPSFKCWGNRGNCSLFLPTSGSSPSICFPGLPCWEFATRQFSRLMREASSCGSHSFDQKWHNRTTMKGKPWLQVAYCPGGKIGQQKYRTVRRCVANMSPRCHRGTLEVSSLPWWDWQETPQNASWRKRVMSQTVPKDSAISSHETFHISSPIVISNQSIPAYFTSSLVNFGYLSFC